MKAPKNFWLLIFIGVLDLLCGLVLSIYVGLSQSLFLGAILAMGFFVSANTLFYFAYRKLA